MLPGKKISPDFLLDVVRRRFWLLSAPLVVCTFAALVVSALLPNMYRAEMLIQTIPQRVPDAYVRSTVTMRTENSLAGVSREVMSRSQLEQLIQEFGLYPEDLAQRSLEDVANKMRANIEVELAPPPRGQPVDAFFIRFAYPDAEVAARVTGRLGSMFVDENARGRGQLADATNEFLESQLAEARGRLEAQERKLEEFRQRHAGRLPSQQDANAEAARSAQMQVQAIVESLARDRDRRLVLERLFREAEAEPVPVPAAAARSAGDVAGTIAAGGSTQQQLDAARGSLANLELRLRPEHPDVVRAKRTVDDLEKKLAAENEQLARRPQERPRPTPVVTPEAAARADRIRQMRTEIESLDRQVAFKEEEERRIRTVITDYQHRIEAVPGLESEWSVLNRDYDTLQGTYRDLLTKSEQSKIAADLEKRQIGEQFRVVDAPGIPKQPISPARLQINGIGAAIGLLIGCALVAFLELRDSSFRTRADVMEVLALPVLARVPLVESDGEQKRRQQRKVMLSAAVAVVMFSGACVFWAMRLWKYVV